MKQIWFVTGSQHLYGADTLKKVAENSQEIVTFLDSQIENIDIIWKPVVKTTSEITDIMRKSNESRECVGVITWMHTFSPSKMWIGGLKIATKPILHLATQFNKRIPYNDIDMDFMNLHQAAHGDREHGFIYALMRKKRKVVVGFWQDTTVVCQIRVWAETCLGFDVSRELRVCRIGDNMREVAVTEGNKVAAELKFGWSVNTYGVGDIVKVIDDVDERDVDALYVKIAKKYNVVSNESDSIRQQLKYEIALLKFMQAGNFSALTTTFEDLHGLDQLPGLAIQRLMEQGYGFGAEGDWKTSALVRILKRIAHNKETSFMEDYTYHLESDCEMVLGAHMLEVCPTIANSTIDIDVQPLGIGGKNPPARMIFDGKCGEAVCVSIVDLGDRFRMIVAKVCGMNVPESMPKLPVARAIWRVLPNFHDGVKAWILAGGAHHCVLSYTLSIEHIVDLARMWDIECVIIDENLDINRFERELEFSDYVYSKH